MLQLHIQPRLLSLISINKGVYRGGKGGKCPSRPVKGGCSHPIPLELRAITLLKSETEK